MEEGKQKGKAANLYPIVGISIKYWGDQRRVPALHLSSVRGEPGCILQETAKVHRRLNTGEAEAVFWVGVVGLSVGLLLREIGQEAVQLRHSAAHGRTIWGLEIVGTSGGRRRGRCLSVQTDHSHLFSITRDGFEDAAFIVC